MKDELQIHLWMYVIKLKKHESRYFILLKSIFPAFFSAIKYNVFFESQAMYSNNQKERIECFSINQQLPPDN